MKRVFNLVVSFVMVFVMLFGIVSMNVYAEGPTAGKIYWVSPEGTAIWTAAKSDTPLEGAACTSISRASQNADAGDTVYIRGGTYLDEECIYPRKSGTSWENQIVFSAYNDEQVTMTNQLCPNRSHEEGAWTVLNGAVAEQSSEQAYNGDYSTKFTVTAGNQGIRSDWVPFKKTSGYVMSAWVWSDQASTINVIVNKGDDSGFIINQDFTLQAGKWNLITKSMYTGVVTGANSYIAFRSPSGSTSGTWYVDNVRVQYYDPGLKINNKDYIKVHGIDFDACLRGFVLSNGADNNEISHCSFSDTNVEWGFDANFIHSNEQSPSTHNWIHHSSFLESGYVNINGDDKGCGLRIGGDWTDGSGYNLIENCLFRHAGGHDNMIVATRYNTIRNNWFRNDGWIKNRQYVEGGNNTNPPYTGNRNILFEDPGASSGFNLLEGNRIGYAAKPSDDDGAHGIENPTDGGIFRYNDIYANGASGYYFKQQDGDGDNNRIYNNTITANGGGESVPSNVWGGICCSDSQPTGNVMKNNIIYNNAGGNYWGGDDTRLYITNTYTNNLESNPEFVDPDITDKSSLVLPDLSLKPNSSAIDFGDALTKVAATDSGTGTSLVVQDATYFQDGSWAPDGKMEADWIAVGSVENVVKIISIDYAAKTITLEQPISRGASDNVWLYKDSSGDIVLNGTSPDIGAHEFFGSKENSAPIITITVPSSLQAYTTGTDLNVEATVRDDVGAVKVEYYLDDIKVGETTAAPFSFTIPGSYMQDGFHKLYGIAYDVEGLFTKSNESTLVVYDPQPLIVNNAQWHNISFDTLDGIVTASYDVMPLESNMNGNVGITLGVASSYNTMAVIIRFKENNTVDAINGTSSYQAVNVIPYTPMKVYRVTVTVDLLNQNYNATVTDDDGNTQVLASNYAFRTQMQPIMSQSKQLDHLVAICSLGSMLLMDYSVGEVIAAESVEITEDIVNLNAIGATRTLTATVLPENATNKELTWTSSNPSVATVDENGTVTAVSDGNTLITAKIAGTSHVAFCVVTVFATSQTTSLTGPSTAKLGDTVAISLKLNGARDISAQDYVMSFDPAVFDFVSASPGNGLTIWKTIEEDESVEIVMASDGAENAVTGNINVLTFTFSVVGSSSTSTLSLTKAKISDLEGNVTNAGLSEKTIAMTEKEVLVNLIDTVEGTLAGAVEGINIGEYPDGTKARLGAALDAAKAVRDNNNATQLQIDTAIADLTEAYDFFLSLEITESTGDFNDEPGIDIGDLGMAARYYGVRAGDALWADASRYDINGDGYIGTYEMAFIVLKMLL